MLVAADPHVRPGDLVLRAGRSSKSQIRSPGEISRTPLPPCPTRSIRPVANDPAFLNYVLYGNATSDTALCGSPAEGIRRQFPRALRRFRNPSCAELTFNGGHPLGDFPLATQQLFPLMIYETVGGQSLLRFPGALFQSAQQGYTSPAGIAATGYVGAHSGGDRVQQFDDGNRSSAGCRRWSRSWMPTAWTVCAEFDDRVRAEWCRGRGGSTIRTSRRA